jgi:hypothetical protein
MKIVVRTLVVSLFLFLCAPGVLARQQWVPFEQEGKWGYQDAQGKVAIKPTFIAAHNFAPEGIAAVIDNAGWGYINRRGTIIIRPFVFDNGPDPFQEGLARFTQEGKFGFFDRKGKIVIKPKFDFAAPFQEGLAAFCTGCSKKMIGEHHFWEGGKWGFINRKGNIAIAAQFDSVKNFNKGRAQVTREGKLIYIDKKGIPITGSKEKEEASIGTTSMEKEVVPSMKDPFTQVLDSEWKKTISAMHESSPTPAFVSWDYYVSPPFPALWPPGADQRLYHYIYAMGLNPQSLADGTYISAPWGRLEIQRKGNTPPIFFRLEHELRKIGIQGVHPLSREESMIYKKKDVAETYLRALASLPDDTHKDVGVLREYYCTWCRHNGAIAEEVRARHIPFFTWLGCK